MQVKKMQVAILMSCLLGAAGMAIWGYSRSGVALNKETGEESGIKVYRLEQENNILSIDAEPMDFVLNSSEIMELVQKYDLNNYGDLSAQVVLERVTIKGDKADNKTANSFPYKRTDKNRGINSIEMYTEYGLEDGNDTRVYVRFLGDVYDNSFTDDVVKLIVEDDAVAKEIVTSIEDGKEFNYTLKLGEHEARVVCDNLNGASGYELRVESNSGVHNGNSLDTYRLSELEQLANRKSLEEVENFVELDKKVVDNFFSLEDKKASLGSGGVLSTKYERAFVRDFDREKYEELNNFKRYYVEKEYKMTDDKGNEYKIELHIDDYDRYNIKRKAFLCVGGNCSKEVLAPAMESLSVDLAGCKYNERVGEKIFRSYILTK